jgi:DNA-binding HxlR family transcriptional regulator
MDTDCDLRNHPGGADAYLRACPSRTVLEVLSSKWTLLVTGALRGGPRRFGELRRRLDGITQKMLSQTLRALERDGLVSRKVYPTVPPQVEYMLTPLGQSVVALLDPIRVWAEDHLQDIVAARAAFDARADRAVEAL